MTTAQRMMDIFKSVSLCGFEALFTKTQELILIRSTQTVRLQAVAQYVQIAISESIAEKESATLQDAESLNSLIQSKIKSYQEQILVVLRLTKHNSHVRNAILNAESLQEVRAHVDEAGCKISPDWAEGCVILAPLTKQLVEEAGIKLRAHHIIVAQHNQDLVEKVLKAIPKRRRPLVQTADDCSSLAQSKALSTNPGPEDPSKHEPPSYFAGLGEWDGLWEVERTFLHVPLPKMIRLREVQSEPCGSAVEPRPLKLPRL